MAFVRVPDRDLTLRDEREVAAYLSGIGIQYERWEPSHPLTPDASNNDILEVYAGEIDRLKQQGGYVTADVIDVHPDTPGLDAMLARFNQEHWHDEDEVRLVIGGRGMFHIHPPGRDVVAVEVEAGDLLRVPRGTHHWFDLCVDRRIRAIRLFQDPAGWTPHYTGTQAEASYQTVCFGPSYFPMTTLR